MAQPTENKYLGKAIRSKEGPRHVSGRGQFTDDFTLPGMLHGIVVRSPYHKKFFSDRKSFHRAPGC